MFASLVVVLPTRHVGGSLGFRHKEEQWKFDSADSISSHTNPVAAYAIFFSDVEHEVFVVQDGYRVTLTYNLYFDEQPSVTLKPMPTLKEVAFKETLSRLLQNPEFFPKGAFLGFGLHHQYPLKRDEKSLAGIASVVKGSDSWILRSCNELSLKSSFKVVYAEDDDAKLLADKRAIYAPFVREGESAWESLRSEHGGKCIYNLENEEKVQLEVHWVTELTTLNQADLPFVAYGNEPGFGIFYGNVCLIVEIGPFGHRSSSPASTRTKIQSSFVESS